MFKSIYQHTLKSILIPVHPSLSSSAHKILPFRVPLFSFCFSSSTILHRKHLDQGDTELNGDPDGPPKLFVLQPRVRPETYLRAKLEEALNLAKSLEERRDGVYETEFLDKEMPPHLVVQHPASRSRKTGTYFGIGTLNNVKCHLNNLESKDGVDAVFVNAILTGVQQRNLELAWDKPVLDRVGLIIEIFNAHAQTKEAKLQAELAALMYKKSRLVRGRGPGGRYTFGGSEEVEVVSARGRGSGGRGFISGAGETELELQQRRISDRRKKLLSEIKEVRRTRATQRAARKRQDGSSGQDIATVAVVGYTNAGKSTLVSALSNNYLYCDDRLFATVDPKLSSVILPSGRKVLLSDTVGFISELPIQLVEAFHATLEEVIEADLLVHVLDSSAQNLDEHRNTVIEVLLKIGVSEEKLQNMIEVWNKVDLLEKESEIEQDYAGSFSGEEDADADADADTTPDQDVDAEASGDLGDDNFQEPAYCSGDWLSAEDEQDSWVDYDGCSIGSAIVTAQENEASENGVVAVTGSQFQPDSTCHVKTSAVTGVGLQELLNLVDTKLGQRIQVTERSIFDRKWRPRGEDDKIAVDQ